MEFTLNFKKPFLRKSFITGFFLLFAFSFSAKAQYIEVDDTYTAQQLVEDVFIGSDNLGCIEILNAEFTNAYNFGGGQMSYGYFNRGNSDFQIEEGVLLTTGRAISAIGPNDSMLSEGPAGNAWPGDDDLEQAIGMSNTVNATALEFDFIAYANSIRFDYIFSSEQYLTSGTQNQCNYTDGFAFLIKRTNVNEPYTNLAVIPDTDTPVAVNTVRGTGGLCPPINEQYFESFNEVEHPTNYNGQTKILTAQTDIVAGEMYHIKLVIADQGNNLYDSAVFLMGGSFSNGTKDLGEDKLIASGNPICEGDGFEIDATTPNATTYQWYKDGEIISGATNPTYQATETGMYRAEIGFATAGCLLLGEIRVEFSANPAVNDMSLVQCENQNGNTAFNLILAENTIIQNSSDFDITYFGNLSDAENNTQNSISNPQNYTPNNLNQPIYARVENQFGCFSVAEISLSTTNNSLQNPSDLERCEGTEIFDLTENQNEIASQVPTNTTYQYFENYEEALLGINEITNVTSYQGENNDRIYVKISENGNCYGVVWFDLIVRSFVVDLSDEYAFLCEGEPIEITAPMGFSDYSWNNGQTTQTLEISQAGSYTVTFTNEFGCTASKTFVVSSASAPLIVSVDINDMTSSGNSVEINAEGAGDYEYSLNGIDYQESNFFANVPSGEHIAFVRGVCGVDSERIFVLDYPKFFTPNGDGINDYWRIPFLATQYPTALVEIYDRYGKLVYGFRAQQPGWDGTFGNEKLPATDYWFVVKLPQRTVRGHFSLVR